MTELEQKELFAVLEAQGAQPKVCDVEVPVYLSTVMCGTPTEMGDEYIEEYRLLPIELVRRIEAYIIKAQGDSMIDMGVESGDELLIESRETVDDGDGAVVLLNGELVLKQFFRDEDGVVWLVPANRDYDAIRVDENDNLRVLGRVRKIMKDTNRRPSFAQMQAAVRQAKEKELQKVTGRPRRKDLKEFMDEEDREQRFLCLQRCMAGQKGKRAAFIIQMAWQLGWFTELPIFDSIQDAFGDIGARSNFKKYLTLKMTSEEQKESKELLLG